MLIFLERPCYTSESLACLSTSVHIWQRMRAGTRDFQGSPIIALPWAQAKNNLPSPELWAPYVWVEPSPGPLRRITRNRLFPPSVPNSRSPHTSGHICCFSGSLRALVASVPVTYPPQCAPGERSQARPINPCLCGSRGLQGPEQQALAAGGRGTQTAAEPTAAPTWDCSCDCCQEPRLPPCIHQFSSVLPPATSVRARLHGAFQVQEKEKLTRVPKETTGHHQLRSL